jgi:signal transduction histidine kinase
LEELQSARTSGRQQKSIPDGYQTMKLDNNRIPLKIAIIYAAVSGFWILFSDKLLGYLVTDRELITELSILKGLAFVIVTAYLLYALIQRHILAVQNQFNQLTTIFDAINAVVYVADMESYEILYLNRFGSSIFGGNWQGRKCYEVFQSGQELPCPFCTNELLTADGKPLNPHIWESQNSVTGQWFQCIDRAIYWTDRRLVRLEIAFDISELKGMERIKDEMVSAVSHEMRTPLTAMLGYTEYILDNEVSPAKQKEFLRTIYQETERLNELIGNFLDLQRLKMRQEPLPMTGLSPEALLRDITALFGAAPKRHRIALECPPDLPRILGNAGQLHQMFLNLVSNAVKYSPEGTIITVGAEANGETVLFRVSDEGVGIPPDMREKIFERFYRIDNTDRRMVGGAGLGLALVREIVSAHFGKVWVESTVGKGSTFCVQLPALPDDTQ